MTRFQMTRRFLTPRVFNGPNIWERAIKGDWRKKFEEKFKNSGGKNFPQKTVQKVDWDDSLFKRYEMESFIFHSRLVSIRTSGYGAVTKSAEMTISLDFFWAVISKFRIRVVKISFIEVIANFWPMQFLGPAENGIKENGSRSESPKCLSGLN